MEQFDLENYSYTVISVICCIYSYVLQGSSLVVRLIVVVGSEFTWDECLRLVGHWEKALGLGLLLWWNLVLVWLEGVHLVSWIWAAKLTCAVVQNLIERSLDGREAILLGGAFFLLIMLWERLRSCHGLFLLDLEIMIPVGWPILSVLIKFVVVFIDLVY